MSSLLPVVIPVSFIILIGFIAGKTLSLDISTLSQFTVYILAPALVADGLYGTSLSAQNMVSLLLGFSLISLLLYGLVLLISKGFKLSPSIHKTLTATTLLPNNGNMGLPMIAFALGNAGLERAIIYMIGSSILMFGITPALLKGKGLDYSIRLTLKLPLLWAMLAGITLRILLIKLPFRLDSALESLGQAAIPIALVILGMQLSSTRFVVGKYEIFATMIRLLIAPLIAYGVGYSLGLQGLDLQVLILQTAMPVAVNTLVLVTEFGGNPDHVARTIVMTTLSSFLTLPLILFLLRNVVG